MDIDKLVKINILFDFYGELLTEKQKEVISLYYNEDYSLSEISENLNISRQAVYDNLKRSEKILISYEEKLKLVEKFEKKNKQIEEIYTGLVEIEKQIVSKQCSEYVPKIKNLKEICRELLK
ncbi:YlxM family DNA-binding protein [Alkalithermobacter paradoxus]|uniref:UPF0122 protein CLOTH_13890 n=1 Tax=Alkalithermobacter paradoxus TaxID=29349 RepID=A0A1V4I6X4_9FIRM|nr:putative DNA-binding protein [[Clostridium] thermoalcaliphilum]